MRPSTSTFRSPLRPCLSPVLPPLLPAQAHLHTSTPHFNAPPAAAATCSPSYTYGRPSLKALKAGIPPIRAHILSEPLPYPVGLKLQGDIIDARLRRRERKEGGELDVMLLLGMCMSTCMSDCGGVRAGFS
jgi:lipoyl(octanoyl) transferase